MAIKVQHITKCFGAQKVLNNITFAIEPGYVTGFLGPNGAGKSSMMKILTGYWKPNDGEAYICNERVAGNNLIAKGLIGYLPEHNPLYLDMYVHEYLSYVAGIYKIKAKKQRIEELINLTGLEREQHKQIHMLSKGYRQRIGLAQALIQDPPVLILDEPTTGLDPNQIIEIRSLISELGKTKTVILSSHILQEVQAMCSRAIIINKGKLVADEQVHALTGITGSQYRIIVETKEYLPSSFFTDSLSISSIKEDKKTKIITSSSDIREEIFNLCSRSNSPILSLRLEELSLEELFREATR